jgi:hypothetical protein
MEQCTAIKTHVGITYVPSPRNPRLFAVKSSKKDRGRPIQAAFGYLVGFRIAFRDSVVLKNDNPVLYPAFTEVLIGRCGTELQLNECPHRVPAITVKNPAIHSELKQEGWTHRSYDHNHHSSESSPHILLLGKPYWSVLPQPLTGSLPFDVGQ